MLRYHLLSSGFGSGPSLPRLLLHSGTFEAHLNTFEYNHYLMSPLSFSAYSDITFLVILLLQKCIDPTELYNKIQLVQSICDCRDPKINPRHREKKIEARVKFHHWHQLQIYCLGYKCLGKVRKFQRHPLAPYAPLLPTLGSA